MGQREASPDRWSWPEWIVLAATVAPFVVGAVALLSGPFADAPLVGDNALNLLRAADVGHHAVLTGPYARDGWNHPGPVMYYLLAFPYRLLGGRPAGLLIGALALNAASVAGIVLIARRLGGRLLMGLVALASATLTAALGPAFLRDPWNPYLAVLPFALLLMVVWDLATGRWWQLPVAAGVRPSASRPTSGTSRSCCRSWPGP